MSDNALTILFACLAAQLIMAGFTWRAINSLRYCQAHLCLTVEHLNRKQKPVRQDAAGGDQGDGGEE